MKYLDPEIPYSMAAENLLMGTCAQESKMGTQIVQLEGGPARGIFQMEPATHDDIWNNFLAYRESLYKLIDGLCPASPNYVIDGIDDLVGNLFYAAAMCRVHYYRVKWPLPADDVEELAHYYKLHYNTPEGKGTIEEFIKNFYLLVA